MRLSPIALLGLCLLSLSALWGVPQSTSEQSNQIEDATSKLTEAFKDVQTASSEGASDARISELTSELNTALSYKENAVLLYDAGNVTGSDYYSSLSGNLSSQVSNQARSLESDANRQAFLGQLWIYSIAQVAAVFSAMVLIEFHRVRNFIRRRRMLKSILG
jgi:hypothetical protein